MWNVVSVSLFALFSPFEVVGIDEIDAQQREQTSQTQWQLYKSPNTKISVFIPSGWYVIEDKGGFEIISPDNFRIGIYRHYKGYSPVFRTIDFSVNQVGQHKVEALAGIGDSLKSFQILKPEQGLVPTDKFGGDLLVYTYNKDGGIIIFDYLKQISIDTVLNYYLYGTRSQIQKYENTAKSILKTFKFDSSWELQQLD